MTSRSNLKQIGLALAIYANDYDGLYPQSLDDLYPNYVSDVVNLSDKLWVVQDDEVIAIWDILARGKRV